MVQESLPNLTLFVCVKQGDASKSKTKVWQNKSKGAKKTAKSKKKKLTKKKATPAPAKTKQANGNVAGNVRVQSQLSLLINWLDMSNIKILCLHK